MGLVSMLGKELAGLVADRREWVQCLVALLLLNGELAINLRGGRVRLTPSRTRPWPSWSRRRSAFLSRRQSGARFDLGEKHSGTAAWVLSKPLAGGLRAGQADRAWAGLVRCLGRAARRGRLLSS